MSFNKAKVLALAQKHLNQGKLPQAIEQFLDILRHDPGDQVALMSLGDLYVRNGEVLKALEFFERLGQIFLKEGFTSKAIAIYKKIAKLVPAESGPLERLAELYTHQGVMSEARPIYLQLAELHIRQGRTDAAVGVLQKLLEAEPDNLRVQTRLAELYQNLGRTQDAARAYLFSAHRALDAGNHAEAERLCGRALELDPGSGEAALLRARTLAAAGKAEEAIAALEALPEQPPGIAPTLVRLFLKAGHFGRAAEAARQAQAADPAQAGLLLDVAAALLDAGDAEGALGLQGEVREALAASGDYERLARTLSATAERLPGRREPLEWLAELSRRVGDTVRLHDALNRLGQALADAGDLERARAAWEEVYERSGDENLRTRLNEVREKLGLEPLAEAAGPKVSSVTTLGQEAAAPPDSGPPMDPETEKFVSLAMTDVDLFSSYGLVQKAMDLLETVLQRAPAHTAALEKLLDLHVGAGNDRRTVELALRLEQLYRERGDEARAEHFAEMRRRYQRVTGIQVEEPAAQEFAVTPVEVSVAAGQAAPPPEAAVYEVDLSAEWAALAQPTETAEHAAAPAHPTEHAEAAGPATDEAPAEEAEEYALEPATPAAAQPMTSGEFLAELSGELDQPGAAPPASAPPEAAAPAPAEPESAVPAAAGQLPGMVNQLQDVFDEFRAELGGMGEDDEDLETHYNLGIAYREMGLVEEAISEFQRVAGSIERGRPFRYAMQCFTLLGLCFMEKNQPKIAAMWYQRALQTPRLDPETVLALRYDLGAAQELAGDPRAALESFTQVYAMNIDYRDVAERIAALEKAARA